MTEEDIIKEHVEELERWQLIHALKGHGLINYCHCAELCADPGCSTGCLNQDAQHTFRAEIMSGVKIIRNSGSNRFPITPIRGSRTCMNHPPAGCHDSLCQVVGCLRKPAFHFRDLIRLAQKEAIFNALKKK